MKNFFLLLIVLTILSCKNENNPAEEDESHVKLHEEMEKFDKELQKFDDQLKNLYVESEKKPQSVILKVDSLLLANRNEKDKSLIKSNVESQLHYFKAELFYNIGKYDKSIEELNFENYRKGKAAIAYSANYVKLKDFKMAKLYIDNIGHWSGNDYALGNYYESIGDKTAALNVYKKIIEDKSIKHYAFYKWTVKRVEELKKGRPLLNEVFFPTGNPSFEVCDSDSKNRTKIFELMQNLPENQDWSGTAILESPRENDKNYYWVRVTTRQGKEFNYYIYQETFKIKFFNPKSKELMTLEEWRKSR